VGLFAGLPPGIGAGFTTRRSDPGGDSPFPVARVLAAALGAADAETVLARQVHGKAVLRADGNVAPGGQLFLGEGDALVTRQRGRLLAVASADCVPFVLADAVSGWIAAVHAGWRGTAARILDPVLDLLEGEGVPPGRLVVAVGPAISPDRYEVGPEVARALTRAHDGIAVPSSALRPGQGDRWMADVAAFGISVLLARGVLPRSILHADLCTAADPMFPSYRREGSGTGRILTGILRL